MEQLRFIDDRGTFALDRPEETSYLYFPLASETGLKSAVTPNLGGDAKLDQEGFLFEPVSAENLHNNRNTRNFWLALENGRIWSAMGASAFQEAARFSADQEQSCLQAGFLWQSVTRTSQKLGLEATVTAFVPKDINAEILLIDLKNIGSKVLNFTPYGAIPIYGRSADNIRDHRNVTSMLHRIDTVSHGVRVCPTMSFDEKGHRRNSRIYYVLGADEAGQAPLAFYPTVEDFLGEGGSYTLPRAVLENAAGVGVGAKAEGKEAMGAFRYAKKTLLPGEHTAYVILAGITDQDQVLHQVLNAFGTPEKAAAALEDTRAYWNTRGNVSFHTGDADFDRLMKWVCVQPMLRRIFGCSFLPHHDYGRGGRGWRDLWQDCLSLLLMDPQNVGRMIEANFSGVRADGTNATIIGEGDGNFKADRNGIPRVWMDHALWPQMTTELYLDQTGDYDLLYRKVPYFKDNLTVRGTQNDTRWKPEDGNLLRTASGEVYRGSILEHLLVQQLAAFFEVGEHNIYQLRGADWNDALDMASHRGESVAFTCAYTGNLLNLAALLSKLDAASGIHEIPVLEELGILLREDAGLYDDIDRKTALLTEYGQRCAHTVSGKTLTVSLSALADNLRRKAAWQQAHLKQQEWLEGPDGHGWFNSYYDDNGRRVEGLHNGQVRMMLTGQVFSIMGGVADENQVARIAESADAYLYQPEIGGYRLNTNFNELKFDMGRMFGFAYGEKENGAVFSHMAVMYANALYRRGFVKEGAKALKALTDAALNFPVSRIYPGIPEYFRADGRGMYHYLTGAASWYMMTVITEVFGMRGLGGDLCFRPKLLARQFDGQGIAVIAADFAGHSFRVTYENRDRREYGSYAVVSGTVDGQPLKLLNGCALLPRAAIEQAEQKHHSVIITLG